ncbi:hypothetical protein FRX31_005259, partial [Thalictrum thalictroides]
HNTYKHLLLLLPLLSQSLTITNKVFWIVILSDLAIKEEELLETLERRITAAYIDSHLLSSMLGNSKLKLEIRPYQ